MQKLVASTENKELNKVGLVWWLLNFRKIRCTLLATYIRDGKTLILSLPDMFQN